MSLQFNPGRMDMRKRQESVWKRQDNGMYSADVKRGEYSNTLRIVVRRVSGCEYTLVVSSINHSGDRDLDDETQIKVDFSRISSIAYRSEHRETGLREVSGPLRISTTGPNAICHEFRFDLSSPRPRTKTECLGEGQHRFPTALPFYGLSRSPPSQEAAVAFFKQKFCSMRAP